MNILKMTNEQLIEKVKSFVPDAEFSESKDYLNVAIHPEKLYQLCTELKNNQELLFDYLFCLTGVDWGTELGVVYHLESTVHKHCIVLKVKTADRGNPRIDTVCDIWRTAESHEREVYDLLGIEFNNHPDLRRLLLDDNWVGYPLRKDYVDEVRMVLR
jgi:NADH-quinone oxidoreductase subunit C